jgi:hypothetical protein
MYSIKKNIEAFFSIDENKSFASLKEARDYVLAAADNFYVSEKDVEITLFGVKYPLYEPEYPLERVFHEECGEMVGYFLPDGRFIDWGNGMQTWQPSQAAEIRKM